MVSTRGYDNIEIFNRRKNCNRMVYNVMNQEKTRGTFFICLLWYCMMNYKITLSFAGDVIYIKAENEI